MVPDLEIPASSLFLGSVYQSDTSRVSIPWSNPRFWSRAWRAVAPNVLYLGLTSLLTDISSEMIVSVLPMYLVLELRWGTRFPRRAGLGCWLPALRCQPWRLS
jgi:hypothetical protein